MGLVEGKTYSRAVRIHKLVYETLHRLAWKSFLEQCKDDEMLHDLAEKLESLILEVKFEEFETVLHDPVCIKIMDGFENQLEFLRTENGSLSAIWMSYLDLVDKMLKLLRASREGDWELHVSSVRAMLPWCFAYDARNYARYMSSYYQDMMTLKDEHPEAYHFVECGGFSVQMIAVNPFGRIPVDQAVEETVNKDTQTPGIQNDSVSSLMLCKSII